MRHSEYSECRPGDRKRAAGSTRRQSSTDGIKSCGEHIAKTKRREKWDKSKDINGKHSKVCLVYQLHNKEQAYTAPEGGTWITKKSQVGISQKHPDLFFFPKTSARWYIRVISNTHFPDSLARYQKHLHQDRCHKPSSFLVPISEPCSMQIMISAVDPLLRVQCVSVYRCFISNRDPKGKHRAGNKETP